MNDDSHTKPTTCQVAPDDKQAALAGRLETRLVLSTFKVNTTFDTVAVNLKTGKDASGHIPFRSAIQAANARPNADTILVPKGTFMSRSPVPAKTKLPRATWTSAVK